MDDNKKPASSAVRWAVAGFAAFAMIAGGLTLVGWFADLPRLTDWIASGISMFPNAAFAAVCTGAALILATLKVRWCARVSGVFGFVVAILGSATLFQHFSGINLGIDTILIEPAWGIKAATSPGRMGPPASTSYALLGFALILLASGQAKARRAVAPLGIGVCLIAALALMGYLSGADPLFAVARYTGIAMQTAAALLALGLAVIASVPEYEPMRTLRQNSAAGLLLRRSLPFVIALPLGLGWLRIRGQLAGWYDTAMGTSLLILLLIVIFSGLVWWWSNAISNYEHALRQERENLEKINREMDLFIQIISHDLRAPLRSIQAFTDILQNDYGDSLKAEAKEFVNDIYMASSQIHHLIDDLVGIFKLSSIKRPYEKFDLAKVLADIIAMLKGSLLHRKVEIITSEIPSEIEGDAVKVRQIFQNLLNNSIKFSGRNGHDVKIRIGYADRGESHEFHVKDNGIGIESEHFEKIFQPFSKLHPKDEYEGSGSGLYIVKKLVEDHKGKVWVNSKIEKGTTFYFSIPKTLISAGGGRFKPLNEHNRLNIIKDPA